MKITEWFKNLILKLLGVEKLPTTPNNERLTYISNDDAIRVEKLRSYKVWYIGDGDELLNYYTNQQTYGWLANPIYNRNKRNYFWGLSSVECDIKRIHSGLPKAIIDTMSVIVGKPTINTNDPRLEEILYVNDFKNNMVNRYRPMSMVEGDGALKWNLNPAIANVPLVEYYEAEDWEPIKKSGILLGMIFKSYYKDKKDHNYVLFEIRRLVSDGMVEEYKLYKIDKENNLSEADFSCVPELANLADRPPMHYPVRKLFAVPIIYYFDPLHVNRGRSVYEGKLDYFDMYDEIWSQASQTNRVSTPVEYYPVDLLTRTKDGIPILPDRYNRQFVAIDGQGDGNGKNNGQILTTQPALNFAQYNDLAAAVLSNILIGYMSPSSFGIDIAKRDNADAQREKEKQTIFTRTGIIDKEEIFYADFLKQGLMLKDYIDTGSFKDESFYEVSLKYDEFANPAFEEELKVLGPAWNQGQLSTRKFVELLWSGKMTPDEMEEEIKWLDDNKQQDDFDMNALMGGNNNENRNSQDLFGKNREEEQTIKPQE